MNPLPLQVLGLNLVFIDAERVIINGQSDTPLRPGYARLSVSVMPEVDLRGDPRMPHSEATEVSR